MLEQFELELGKLSPNGAFETAYRGYEFLRDLGADPGSETWRLMKRIAAGDAQALMQCWRKMMEEQDEADGVVKGRHRDIGLTPRTAIIKEAQQFIYWPEIVAVSLRAPYDVINLPHHLRTGFEGLHPVEAPKAYWKEGVEGQPYESAAAVFRRALVDAGNFLRDYNDGLGSGHGIALPRHLADWDLTQMAERRYFHPFLRERGLLPR